MDPWQQYVNDSLYSIDSEGYWSAKEFGLLVARQNGKGEILVGYDLVHLFLFPRLDNTRKTILHTSHEMKTSLDAFERLLGVLESVPELMAKVDKVRASNGQEGILLKKRDGQKMGDRIRFIARSKNSGRGFSADTIIYDEAQQLSHQSQAALTYTQTQVKNRQEFFTGTVPEDGVNDLEVWQAVRDRGRAGKNKGTAWMEWSPVGSEDYKTAATISLSDPKAISDSNPSLIIRLPPESIINEYEKFSESNPEGFLRERLSVWPNTRPAEEVKRSDLDMNSWRAGVNSAAAVVGPRAAISIAVGRGTGYATIGKAYRMPSGRLAVEHHATKEGTLWVADEVAKLKKELGNALVVVDPKNASVVLSSLDGAGVKYMRMSLDEITAAHASFIEHVNAGLVEHRDQKEVTLSLEYAQTRAVGRSGETWEPSDPKKPITMAQVVTWSMWGVLKSENSRKGTPTPPPQYAILPSESSGDLGPNINDIQF
ncbi:terminase large subunit [Rathayibacter phage NCPPB3778]|nr:terminase large subunit [Rathayibacter phage NCPPB3778]